jgi:hypothetical protein
LKAAGVEEVVLAINYQPEVSKISNSLADEAIKAAC